MKETLKIKEKIYVGSLIFGLFFGAGNLIFPIQMGQEAGSSIGQANLGFLITGIGLPFLGIIAFGLSNTTQLSELAGKVNRPFSIWFTTTLYLIIGPLFAMPRLASTSYEVALSMVIPDSLSRLALCVFSIFFFLAVWLFARKPTKILDYIGKFLTPVFLLLLFILLGLNLLFPLGSIDSGVPQGNYQTQPFMEGFLQGYNTLDALAALAFGMLIIDAVKGLGIDSPKRIAKEVATSGLIGIFVMGVIYSLLSLTGALSLGTFSLNANGGITLSRIAYHYLGNTGFVLLGVTIIFACLKTAIGLATSFGKTFDHLYAKGNYELYTMGSIVIAVVIANVGLNQIIALSIPVLMFIYPPAMVLILLSLFSPVLRHYPKVFQTTMYLTLIAAMFDFIKALPTSLASFSMVESSLSFAERYIPLFNMGLGWVSFAVVGVVIGLLLSKKSVR